MPICPSMTQIVHEKSRLNPRNLSPNEAWNTVVNARILQPKTFAIKVNSMPIPRTTALNQSPAGIPV